MHTLCSNRRTAAGTKAISWYGWRLAWLGWLRAWQMCCLLHVADKSLSHAILIVKFCCFCFYFCCRHYIHLLLLFFLFFLIITIIKPIKISVTSICFWINFVCTCVHVFLEWATKGTLDAWITSQLFYVQQQQIVKFYKTKTKKKTKWFAAASNQIQFTNTIRREYGTTKTTYQLSYIYM